MSVEDNKAKVRAFYEEAVNKGALAAVDDLVAPMEIAHYSGGAVGQNTPTSVKKWVTDIRSAFPDIHVTIEDLIADGDKLVNRVTYRGTHNGELNDPVWGRIAPTGKQITWMAIAINRFADGKSVEAWDLMDDSGIWQQLALIPAPKPSSP
jgi:predicted ester cyclase